MNPEDDFATAKKTMIDRFEREIVAAALREAGGNISQAARRLGLQQGLPSVARDFNPGRGPVASASGQFPR